MDFKIKMFELDTITVKTQFWDMAGQSRFRNLTIAYFRSNLYYYIDAKIVCLCFSLADI
jgi:GTPase SAR1 family protein